MKNKKTIVSSAVIAVLVIAIIVGILGLKGAGIGPFSGSSADKPKVEHQSANGVTTWDNGVMRTELTALELTELMGNGINLGNTMEAYGRASFGTTAAVSNYETFWGQPVTTQEMITGMKNAGFDTLRIPIAWTNAMAFESGDFTISEDYLNRVEEIINYALNEDMYVIINDHWDGSWWGMFGSATPEVREKAMDLYISMWTQIANRYKEYSDYLIFESANEELGSRLNDTDIAADSGTLSVDECYEMTNKINQTFVDTIRSTGGNNKQRFLLIAGYNTDIVNTCDERFQMPVDTADNKLMVSVHFYTPWGYCGNTSLSRWGTRRNYTEQNTLLEMMTKFTDAGYGVIIGEYAVAMKTDNTVKDDTCEFFTNFLNNCDMYNYCPVLWDCSNLYVRRELRMQDDATAALFSERSYAAQSSKTPEQIHDEAAAAIEEALNNAVSTFDEDGIDPEDTGKAVAWIMFNSGDWGIMYSVGDTYDPVSKTDGLKATDVEITGPGNYTVGLDFTGTAGGYEDGTAFSALAIGNGELLFPGYVVNITEISINGEAYTLNGVPYTTSDDGKCTRVNLYNGWVSEAPDDARTATGSREGLSPAILNPDDLVHVETLYITFEYGPVE